MNFDCSLISFVKILMSGANHRDLDLVVYCLSVQGVLSVSESGMWYMVVRTENRVGMRKWK